MSFNFKTQQAYPILRGEVLKVLLRKGVVGCARLRVRACTRVCARFATPFLIEHTKILYAPAL